MLPHDWSMASLLDSEESQMQCRTLVFRFAGSPHEWEEIITPGPARAGRQSRGQTWRGARALYRQNVPVVDIARLLGVSRVRVPVSSGTRGKANGKLLILQGYLLSVR